MTKCQHCGNSNKGIKFFMVCDSMNEKEHEECTEACNPQEIQNQNLAEKEALKKYNLTKSEIDFVIRCAKCNAFF